MSKATDGAGVSSAFDATNTRGTSARRAFFVVASSAASAPRLAGVTGVVSASSHPSKAADGMSFNVTFNFNAKDDLGGVWD